MKEAESLNTTEPITPNRIRTLRSFNRKVHGFGFDSPHWMAYFWSTGLANISLGVSICVDGPHIEVHVPFGFFRIGRKRKRARETNDWDPDFPHPIIGWAS